MVRPERLTILLTGAGAPGVRGSLFALRHNPDDRPVRVVGVDLDPEAVGRHFLDAFHVLPAPERPEYLDRLRMICTTERIDLVIPQTTREIAVLSAARERLREEGITVMVGTSESVRLANDKWHVIKAFEKAGLPTPRCYRVQTPSALADAARELGYPSRPVVVKPPFSNGMRGVRVLRESAWDVSRFLAEKPTGLEITLDELLGILERGASWPELLLMEYLPGDEYSVDAFIGQASRVALPRLRARIRSGISFITHVVSEPTMSEDTLRVAKDLGLEYTFGFQYKRDVNGVPKVLECNPRVQGTMVASVFAGVNVIWLGVREAIGAPSRDIPTPRPASFYRFWGGIGVDENGQHAI
jgi:carbamoyl-phosphate synthase large subunit